MPPKQKSKPLITSIIVDDRERKVIPFFEEYEISVSQGRVTTGDYSIVIKEKGQYKPVVIFERKSWKDFADSIKDNRMSNNENLKELRDKLGCRIIFIVEGQPFPVDNRKFRGIPFKNIKKKVDAMMLVDGFHIVQTRDPKMTAKRIVEIAIAYDQYYDKILEVDAKKIKKGGNEEESTNSESDSESESENKEEDEEDVEETVVIPKVLTQVRRKTNDHILQQMWTSLPQVSVATAKILSDKWSISELICGKVFERDIAILKYPSGVSIGNERAKKILLISKDAKGDGNVATLAKAMEITRAQEKLLQSIQGVSAVVAKQICKKYTLKKLCTDVSEKDLSQVKRSDQTTARNIGPAIAKRIITLLRSKNE